MPVVALPESSNPVRLFFDSGQQLSEESYLAFCEANPGLRVERSSEGEIVIVPPPGGESDYRSNKIAAQLDRWAGRTGQGRTFGSSAQFILPDGSALSPDAAWVSNEALGRLTREQRKQFLRLVPEFIVEVLSPSDRLKQAQEKMDKWIANGAQLAWLIDGDARTVYIYRNGEPARLVEGVRELAGEGPVAGLLVEMQPVWDGLG